jgi:hypothetical protein
MVVAVVQVVIAVQYRENLLVAELVPKLHFPYQQEQITQ